MGVKTKKTYTNGTAGFSRQSFASNQLTTHRSIAITGSWDMGWSLDLHTISSTKTGYGWENERTEIGEALYDLKYKDNRSKLWFLAQQAVTFLWDMDLVRKLDIVIPAPFSQKRSFQPVHELAKVIGQEIEVSADLKYVYKKSSSPMKKDMRPEEKKKILKKSIRVEDSRHQGRNVLLFDDLYCSGSTLEVVSQKLREVGKVRNIYVLTLTKTRTKR
jgi:competence protein ComFC